MATVIGDVLARFGIDANPFLTGLKVLEDRWKQSGRRIEDVGSTLSLRLTAPLAGAAIGATALATKFDTTMTQISTLTNVSQGDVARFRGELLALGPALGQRPTALAEGLLRIASAGAVGSEALDIVTSSAKASSVGLGDIATIGGVVTAALRAYGSENLSAAQATDILVAGVREGAAEASQFAGALGAVIAPARTLNVPFAEVVGFIATFTRLGGSADEAATALRGTLAAAANPSKEAAQLLASVGLSAAKLRAEIRDKGLTAALIDLVGRFHGNEEALFGLIGNVRAVTGVLSTASAQGKDFAQITANITNSTGALDTAFQRVSKTTAFTFDQFKAKAEAVGIAFGNQLAPAFQKALEASQPLLDKAASLAAAFSNLSPETQTTVISLLAVAAAAGPVLVVLGNLVLVGSALLPVLGSVGVALAALALSPVGLVLVGIATAAVLVWQNLDSLSIIAQRVWIEIESAVATGAAGVLRALVSIGNGLAWVASKFGDTVATANLKAQVAAIEGLADDLDAKVRQLGDRKVRFEFDAAPVTRVNQLTEAMPPLLESVDAATNSWLLFGDAADAASRAPAPAGAPKPTGGGGGGGEGLDLDRLKQMADAEKQLAQDLALARGEAQLFGASFDLPGAELGALRSGLEALLKAGLSPTSEKARELRDRIVALEGDTTSFTRSLEHAQLIGALLGDTTGSLQAELNAVEERMGKVAEASGNQLTPELIDLQARWVQLQAALRQSEVMDRIADQAKQAALGLSGLDRELDSIGRKAAALANVDRSTSLLGLTEEPVPGLGEQVQTARTTVGNAAAAGVTGPEFDVKVGQLEQLTRLEAIVGGIQNVFTSVADNISQAFDRSVLGIIQGTTTIQGAFANLGQSILLSWGSSLARMAADTAAHWLTQAAVWLAGELGLIAIHAGGAAARETITTTETSNSIGQKLLEGAIWVVTEGVKTGASIVGSISRQAQHAVEFAYSIGQKIYEGAVWVATEAVKTAAQLGTVISGITGAISLGVAWIGSAIGTGIAWAIVGAELIILFATTAAESISSALSAAWGWIASAAAAAASAVAGVPYVGPILAIAAAAAIVGGLTALVLSVAGASKGASIEEDQFLFLHKGEMVLPAKYSSVMDRLAVSPFVSTGFDARDAALSFPSLRLQRLAEPRVAVQERAGWREGQYGTGDTHFHFNAVDAASVQDLFEREGDTLARVMRQRLRDFDPSFQRR